MIIFNIIKHPSNKGERCRRVFLSVLYQLFKRVRKSKMVFKLANGFKIYLRRNCASCSQVVYFRLPDFDELNYLRSQIMADDIIFDIGGNIGHVSLLLADKNPKGAYYIFEPHPKTFSWLSENLQLNGNVNLNAFNLALSNNEGSLNFTDEAESCINRIVNTNEVGTTNTISVEATTLDNFIAKHSVPKIDIIKIDVEGYELNVFEGFRDGLVKFAPRIILFENSKNFEEIKEFLGSYGYSFGRAENGTLIFDDNVKDTQNIFAVKR